MSASWQHESFPFYSFLLFTTEIHKQIKKYHLCTALSKIHLYTQKWVKLDLEGGCRARQVAEAAEQAAVAEVAVLLATHTAFLEEVVVGEGGEWGSVMNASAEGPIAFSEKGLQ